MNLHNRDNSRYMRHEMEKSVYLCTRNTDMRKSINGLAAIVQGYFGMDPFDGTMFVFINRTHDKIKILTWDADGFVLHYKRREKGRFQWPSKIEGGTEEWKNVLQRFYDDFSSD